MRSALAMGMIAFAATLLVLLPAGSGNVSSPDADCRVVMNDVDAADIAGNENAITGDRRPLAILPNQTVDVEITTEHRIARYDFFMQYGPIAIPIFNDTARLDSNLTYDAFFFDASQFTQYGLGLYQITGTIQQRDNAGGIHDCRVSVLFRVTGNPLTTTAGAAATAVGIGAMAGLIQGLVSAYMDSKEVVDAIKDIRDWYKAVRQITK